MSANKKPSPPCTHCDHHSRRKGYLLDEVIYCTHPRIGKVDPDKPVDSRSLVTGEKHLHPNARRAVSARKEAHCTGFYPTFFRWVLGLARRGR